MRQQREQFLRFVDDSVGAAYVPPFDSFPTLLVEVRTTPSPPPASLLRISHKQLIHTALWRYGSCSRWW